MANCGCLIKRGKDGKRLPRKEWSTTGVFYLRLQVNGKATERSLKTSSLREAKRLQAEITDPLKLKDSALKARAMAAAAEMATKKWDDSRPKLPIGMMWEKFPYTTTVHGRRESDLGAETAKDYHGMWHKFVSWADGSGIAFAAEVMAENANDFRDGLVSSGLSGSRVNKVIQTCRVMFRSAGIEPNPFDGIRQRADVAHGRRELSESELRAVCGMASGELRTLLAIGIYTGLRLSHAATLQWEWIDIDAGMIRFPERIRTTKNTPERLPIHPVLAAILAERQSRSGPVLPDACATVKRDKTALTNTIRDHLEACGIVTQERYPDRTRATSVVGFHSLRHSFISMAARGGQPLHVLQAIAGHGPKVQQLYLHATMDDERAVMASLPDVMGSGEAESPGSVVDRAAALLRTATADTWQEVVAAVLKMLCK